MHLKTTTTRCPVCLDPVPGQVVASEGKKVYLEPTCPAHGNLSKD